MTSQTEADRQRQLDAIHRSDRERAAELTRRHGCIHGGSDGFNSNGCTWCN